MLPQTGKERFVTPCLVTTFPGGPVGSPACPFLGPEAPLFNDKRDDNDFSWRIGAEWEPSPDLLVYANLTRGYRAGGFSLPFAGAATEFEPEEIFAKEIGVKGDLLQGEVQYRAAVYQYDFDDVQVNVDDPVSPLVPVTRNVGEQENFGAEVEFEWGINDFWYIKQGLGYLDAEYVKSSSSISTYAGIIPLEGKRPVNSPEWTYNGVVRFDYPMTDRVSWNSLLTFAWTDERFLEATNQPFDFADGLLDSKLSSLRSGLKVQAGKSHYS